MMELDRDLVKQLQAGSAVIMSHELFASMKDWVIALDRLIDVSDAARACVRWYEDAIVASYGDGYLSLEDFNTAHDAVVLLTAALNRLDAGPLFGAIALRERDPAPCPPVDQARGGLAYACKEDEGGVVGEGKGQ